MLRFFFLLLLLPVLSIAQKKQITLEDIYKNGTFRSESFAGFTNESIDSIVNATDIKDENGKQISLNDYLLSDDKKRILVFTNKEQIYRRSSKSIVYLHDIIAKKTRLYLKSTASKRGLAHLISYPIPRLCMHNHLPSHYLLWAPLTQENLIK